MLPMNHQRPLLTVTELTMRIRQVLENGFSLVALQGEISNLKKHTSGHIYFTLKDEHAQISAVLWRSRTPFLSFAPGDGMRVVVTGRVTVYEQRGIYQIEVYSLRAVGVGELQLAFERLKRKLLEEGLFDQARKRKLPEYPERIGIITSRDGAALPDILKILNRRLPSLDVILRPVRVQGEGAAAEIAAAIEDLNTFGGIDLLIVGRGGGSIEDLWAYNEELVARAIFNSRIPVVSAVGHEIDITIADLVADLRAPTPSAAAEMVVKDRQTLLETVGKYWYHIHESIQSALVGKRENIRHLLSSYSFRKPIDLLRQSSQRIDELERNLATAVTHRHAMANSTAGGLQRRLLALNPELTLKRGYAIVSRNGKIITSSKVPTAEDVLDVRFHDGVVRSTVS